MNLEHLSVEMLNHIVSFLDMKEVRPLLFVSKKINRMVSRKLRVWAEKFFFPNRNDYGDKTVFGTMVASEKEVLEIKLKAPIVYRGGCKYCFGYQHQQDADYYMSTISDFNSFPPDLNRCCLAAFECFIMSRFIKMRDNLKEMKIDIKQYGKNQSFDLTDKDFNKKMEEFQNELRIEKKEKKKTEKLFFENQKKVLKLKAKCQKTKKNKRGTKYYTCEELTFEECIRMRVFHLVEEKSGIRSSHSRRALRIF